MGYPVPKRTVAELEAENADLKSQNARLALQNERLVAQARALQSERDDAEHDAQKWKRGGREAEK